MHNAAIVEWEDSDEGHAWREAMLDADADEDRRRWEEEMAEDKAGLDLRLTEALGALVEVLTYADRRPGLLPSWLRWMCSTAADAIRQYADLHKPPPGDKITIVDMTTKDDKWPPF